MNFSEIDASHYFYLSEQTFLSVLEENLHCQLTALPRLMRTADDKQKLRTLNVLNGYIDLLGDKFGQLLTSASHLKRLSLALIQVKYPSVSLTLFFLDCF